MRWIAIAGLLACGSSTPDNPKAKPLPPQPTIEDGIRITYSMDLDGALDAKAEDIVRDLRRRTSDVVRARTLLVPVGSIEIVLVDPTRRDDVITYVTKTFPATLEPQPCELEEPAHLCMRLAPASAEGLKRVALEKAVEVIRRRFEATKVVGNVSASGINLIVDLAAADDDAISATRDLIARTAKLELFVVDDGTPIMRALFSHAFEDPAAKAFEIKAETDVWRTESGDRHADYYLTAPDRTETLSTDEARRVGCRRLHDRDPDGRIRCNVRGRDVLQRYLDALRKDPEHRIPDDRRLGYEYVEPASDVAVRPFWRTYLLDRAVVLSGDSIMRATATLDPTTKHPMVLVDLDPEGSKAFEELTRTAIGKKIAIVLDDRVKSAPVIMSEISGGRLSISMGGHRADRQQQEANELAIALTSGRLPAPVREETVVELKDGVPQPLPTY